MTAFERDLELAKDPGEAYEKMMHRRELRIAELKERIRTTRNGFIARCARQDLERETEQYRRLALTAGDEV